MPNSSMYVASGMPNSSKFVASRVPDSSLCVAHPGVPNSSMYVEWASLMPESLPTAGSSTVWGANGWGLTRHLLPHTFAIIERRCSLYSS